MLDGLADVSEVENGRAMLDLIEAESFDLAISDVQMPIMDGPEAIKALRNWEAVQGRNRLTVVLATADAEMSLAKAQSLGADAVLTKPFTIQSLFATVQPLVGARAAPSRSLERDRRKWIPVPPPVTL